MTDLLQKRVAEYAERCILAGALKERQGLFNEDDTATYSKKVLNDLQEEWTIIDTLSPDSVEVSSELITEASEASISQMPITDDFYQRVDLYYKSRQTDTEVVIKKEGE